MRTELIITVNGGIVENIITNSNLEIFVHIVDYDNKTITKNEPDEFLGESQYGLY